MGGLEILVVSSLIGGILGYFFRSKSKNISPLAGIVLGFIGAVIMGFVLVEILFKSLLAVPFYAIFGAWFFNYIIAKLKK